MRIAFRVDNRPGCCGKCCDIDAQLPKRLARWLSAQGHDAKHTLDLPLRNRTPDSDILTLAEQEARVVVTKDDDFVQSFLVNG